MECRKRISVLLLLSFLLSVAVAHQTPIHEEEESANNSAEEADLESQESKNEPQIQRRHGFVAAPVTPLHYHLPASTGYAYAAKSYYAPVAKYPVYKTFATAPTPVHHHVSYAARPSYALQHGGASVSSYNVNYPRYPLYRPVLKVAHALPHAHHTPVLRVPTTTVLKPTVFSAPAAPFAPIAPVAPVLPQKPFIPIAFNPVFQTPAPVNPIRPFVYPQVQQPVFNPAILAGLNPQFVPVSVSNGAVFTNYPTLAPAPIAPSAWKPIAVPTVPTVQRPSISILPPFASPASTVATLADPIYHHQFAQHVPSPTPVTVAATAQTQVLSDSHDHHQHFLPTGQGEFQGAFNYNQQQQGFTSQGATASGHSGPSNTYLGPSSYEVELNSVQQQQNNNQEQSSIYHPDGGYQ